MSSGATRLTSTAKDMGKVYTMRSKNNGNYLFFEDNIERKRVYYTLVSADGRTLRKGEMSICSETFIDYMERIGFEYLRGGELL